MRQALENPYIVGTHWFQYEEQAVFDQFDGENYFIGFVDITDQPYAELVAARYVPHRNRFNSRFGNPESMWYA